MTLGAAGATAKPSPGVVHYATHRANGAEHYRRYLTGASPSPLFQALHAARAVEIHDAQLPPDQPPAPAGHYESNGGRKYNSLVLPQISKVLAAAATFTFFPFFPSPPHSVPRRDDRNSPSTTGTRRPALADTALFQLLTHKCCEERRARQQGRLVLWPFLLFLPRGSRQPPRAVRTSNFFESARITKVPNLLRTKRITTGWRSAIPDHRGRRTQRINISEGGEGTDRDLDFHSNLRTDSGLGEDMYIFINGRKSTAATEQTLI
ncbi:hypothetical protein B0H11DRAFT_1920424 [Mycena galericulata]|nr:hypothetical protein B0H11DRAFT_1920424 [Mycena galericulata]